jgi:hypothetical protein
MVVASFLHHAPPTSSVPHFIQSILAAYLHGRTISTISDMGVERLCVGFTGSRHHRSFIPTKQLVTCAGPERGKSLSEAILHYHIPHTHPSVLNAVSGRWDHSMRLQRGRACALVHDALWLMVSVPPTAKVDPSPETGTDTTR